jgi:hypothetical protein
MLSNLRHFVVAVTIRALFPGCFSSLSRWFQTRHIVATLNIRLRYYIFTTSNFPWFLIAILLLAHVLRNLLFLTLVFTGVVGALDCCLRSQGIGCACPSV